MPTSQFILTPLDISIVLGEIALVVIVGLWAARGVEQTAKGYFLASGKMPWYLIGLAFVSTSVSSEQIVGTVGRAYASGLPVANFEWWCLPTYVLVMVFFIPLYLHNRIMTVPELLTRRFGPVCGEIYSYVMLVSYVFVFLAPVLYSGAVTFSSLTGWNLWAVMLGTVVIVGAYTIAGGLGSIMWADALQCVLLVLGGVILFFVSLNHIPGGWLEMMRAAPDRFHLYRPANDPEFPFLGLIVATFGYFLFYQATNQIMIQRVLSARTTWDGLMGIVFAGFINLMRPLVTCLLGLIVWHWIEIMHRDSSLFPDRQDQAFPYALAVFAPSGLRGAILAGFVAAVMSTLSAQANAVGTIFALDVYHRVFRRQAGDRELINAGRVAAGAALLLACLATPLVGQVGIFKYFQTGVSYVATPFVSVILLGLLWKRTNYTAATVGLVGGLAMEVALVTGLWTAGIKLNWLYVAGIAQLLTMALTAAVTLCTAPAPREKWEPFHWTPALLSHMDDGRVRPWWQQVKFWFAIYAVIWCGVYVWFW